MNIDSNESAKESTVARPTDGSDQPASPDTNSDSDTEEKDSRRVAQTLGVLFVHGIGARRRGDALVQCVTALHGWLRAWLTQGHFGENIAVDLVDVRVAEGGPEQPAQARLIFRRGSEVSRYSWLFAESCWFETYRRPGFYEFARWALRVIPVAVVIHFLPRHRRAWAAFTACQNALKEGVLRTPGFIAITQAIGLAAAEKKLEDLAHRDFLEACGNSMMWTCLCLQLKLTLWATLGIVIQLLLLLVTILAAVPGVTRSIAGWVQRKLSATLGDSYLFLTSPITEAAVDTRVQKDFEWLGKRCDKVIIAAHSQGAAVSYAVINRTLWGGHAPEKLDALITYGSGLRKLFDLKQTERELPLWTAAGVFAMVTSAAMAGLVGLFLRGQVPWWAALLGIAIGVLLQTAPMSGPAQFVADPEILTVPWFDFYASHDPVPNGPIDFRRRQLSDDDSIASVISTYADVLFVEAFKSRQQEVENRRSTIADHTSYWSSPDDFVAGVAKILARASDTPIYLSIDDEWLKVSRERRRWRVTWLSQCRTITALAALSILFWPQEVLRSIGAQAHSWAEATVPKRLATFLPAMSVPGWLWGAAALIVATWLLFLLASVAWRAWEEREIRHFFRRQPHSSVGLAAWIFGIGWIGVLTLALVLTIVRTHIRWDALLMMVWAPGLLAVWSGWNAIKTRNGPGTPLDMGHRMLSYAERLLADIDSDRNDALGRARYCFQQSQEWLRRYDLEAWALAVRGETRVIEELAKTDESLRKQTAALYRKAIEILERSGQDASEVKTRLASIGQ